MHKHDTAICIVKSLKPARGPLVHTFACSSVAWVWPEWKRNVYDCGTIMCVDELPSSFFSAPSQRKSTVLWQNTAVCPNCYQWLQPDNHRMRLKPKQRPSARVQSILRRKARGKQLSLVQKKLLHCFQRSSSVLVRRQNAGYVFYCTAAYYLSRKNNSELCPQV